VEGEAGRLAPAEALLEAVALPQLAVLLSPGMVKLTVRLEIQPVGSVAPVWSLAASEIVAMSSPGK
jgi:hypothetical protein